MKCIRLLVAGSTLLCLACGPARGSRTREADTDARTTLVDSLPEPVAIAFWRLDRELAPADRDSIRVRTAEQMIEYHFSLGLHLRNEYGLWQGGPLQDYFVSRGVTHPDEMSGILLEAYRQYLRGARVDLDSLIRKRITRSPPPIVKGYHELPPPEGP